MNAHRELLELAAKAAGYDPMRVTDDGVVLLRGVVVHWNRLRMTVIAFASRVPSESASTSLIAEHGSVSLPANSFKNFGAVIAVTKPTP